MAAVKKQTQTGAGKKAANLAKKASAKNQASRQKEAKPADGREGSKKNIILELLRRQQGVTITEISKATQWQNHSIRGFISGTITKKMGFAVESAKNDAGERTYRIAQ